MDAVLDDCMEVGPAYLHEQPRRHPLLCQFDAGVQEFEGAAKLSVLPMDFTGEEFKNANSLEYFSILEKAVKDFTKEFYSNALKDELTDARKEASKGNKELSKVVREKEKAENEIVKSEKRINGTESDILKYQQKIKELENQIQSAKASIEDSKQNIVENKLQTIELTKEIRDKTKMVETLKEKERKITEKLEFIMGL